MARVLLIDDDSEMRRLLLKALKTAGHDVTEASNGKEGVALYQEHPADLVITDLFMPEKDGYGVIADILRGSPEAKIISITEGGGDDCAKARELGAVRTFVKPFPREELLDAIGEVLDE